MTRSHWITVASWTVPSVCLVLAFFIGWYQYRLYKDAVEEEHRVTLDIHQKEDQLKDATRQTNASLTAPADNYEEPKFLSQLQGLARDAGVKFTQITPTAPIALPTIGMPPASNEANSSAATNGDASKTSNEPSILNLPRGATAKALSVTARGRYGNLRNFLYLTKNYRYGTRAININDAVLSNLDEKTGLLDAKMTLTRFVRPHDLTNPLLAPDSLPSPQSALPGNTTGTPTVSSMPSLSSRTRLPAPSQTPATGRP